MNIITEIVNEDGTSLCNFPENPLKEKWSKLYPPIPKPEFSQVCDGYSCIWCGRCPSGSDWEVPNEDLEIWNEYKQQILEYHRIHNPKIYDILVDKKKVKRK